MENKNLHYILGLDLGIASVGWAVVEINKKENPLRLIDVGVRTFERAETQKGESLALSRRSARSARRLTQRRVARLKKAKRLLKSENILLSTDERLPHQVWQLRVEGLDRKLERQEWAAVLLHLIKHRGYLSQRKNESKSENKELGALLSGVASNHELLQQATYRTPAELAVKKFEVEEGHIRNQQGAYTHTFSRLDLLAEMELLFSRQQHFGNPFASEKLLENLTALLMWQKPALSGEAILKMLGKCTFEDEYKAAKNTYTAERFVWITKLNNLRIQENGLERVLNDNERLMLIEQPYEKAKLTYAQVRSILNLSDDAIFKGVRYSGEDKKAIETKTTLMEMKAYHQIRKVLEGNNLKAEWVALKANLTLLDEIGTAFSLYKTDEDISAYLAGKLSQPVLNALLENLSFDKFIQLSLKALYKLLPLMQQGLRYDEACTKIYGDHYSKKTEENHHFLPQIPADEIRNPVVLRTLTQARKVINGVVRLYGSPARIHIETGREVGKSYKDRHELKKRQEENRKQREKTISEIKTLFPNFSGEPKGKDILKMRLYYQQNAKCLYSGKPLELHRLFEQKYVEVDHALPLSRTWDDSFNNKVLVLANENQNKGNLTPFEWLDGKNNSERWRTFKALVETSAFPYAKKQRILSQKLDEKGFIERNLNDTRYVARFLCNFIADNMHLTGEGKRKVFASNGQITALLRRRWGLAKSREDNDRHHALDAVLVACSTVSMQQKITRFVRFEEGNVFTGERVDRETGEIIPLYFPAPWELFREEVEIRIFSDNPKLELENRLPDRPQANHEFVQPLFVSRMPTRKMTGQGHMETVKSAKRLSEGISVIKMPLTKLKLKDLELMVNREREKDLYDALKARLEAFNDDPAKAFAEPFMKKGGAIVKSVRVEQVQKSGVLVHAGNGVADNASGSIVRVDVFIKDRKYFLVPIYTWQVAKGILPNRAVIADTDENEWEMMDENSTFQFSLHPNDLIRVKTKKDEFWGYFNRLNRHTGGINIRTHDLEKSKGKQGIFEGIGVKIALSFEKYQVDELGKNIRLCKPSKRQPVR